MTDESLSTPEKLACVHKWMKVEGATSGTGGMVVMCNKCNATKDLDPPVNEDRGDSRPLLLE